MSCLFVGRYQPFHDGHKALIETVLKEGKRAVIAIRNTALNSDNPFNFEERVEMIRDAMREHLHSIEIIKIPDISEICYGREVGYKIRRIKLEEDIEKISATDYRLKHIR